MGLSSLPIQSDGMLTLLVVNTAFTISIVKEIFRSVLHTLGLAETGEVGSTPELAYLSSLAESTLTERFRSRVKPVLFGRRLGEEGHLDCRVCLSRFEPGSVVNRLPCGHLFHKSCVERLLDYRNTTCPLCRRHLLPADDLASSGIDISGFL
ncbi:hypothetical protein HPP92_022559 [Vanilla planifolia]|nr:hypothetical protein HPP92_022559 [Vanilla planifolia]